MRIRAFSIRVAKEILRDPLNICFGLGFPVVLILLLSAIQSAVPEPMFALVHLTPGITVFGLSFLTLFSATLLSRDRESAFLARLCTTPLSAAECIFGYILPILPMAAAQGAICYVAAMLLGLAPQLSMVWAILSLMPIALFYISFGLCCGSLFGVKQVGGICGAGLTNLSAWLSGVWFDVSLIGGVFADVAYALPFIHAVELERAILRGDGAAALTHLPWIIGYTAVFTVFSVLLFHRQRKRL